MPSYHPRRAYKEVTLQQLRSFCAAARLGSMSAAAGNLGLSQPTVCEQIHALERAVDALLVERHARGCRLTDAGRVVAELSAPMVAGMESLGQQLRQAVGRAETRLTVAATQRILVEELPPAITTFRAENPTVQLRFLEQGIEHVVAAVEAGDADLGLAVHRPADRANPRLVFEPGYELDLVLVTPIGHPLARKRRVEPADLARHPLVNAPGSIPDPAIAGLLEKAGAFHTEPRQVEAYYTAVIRRFVEMGFGIGLVLGLPGHVPRPGLCERTLGKPFGRVGIDLVWRKGNLAHGPARLFAQTIRTLLGREAAEV